jgi:di/tricarboxylate transporter
MLTSFILLSVVLLLGLLAWGKVQAYKLFLGLLLFYYAFDLIKLESMLQNFVNPALVTLALLLMVSQVLEKTNFFQLISNFLIAPRIRSSIFRMGGLVGLGSAFLNNTAVVASLMTSVGKSQTHPSSKLLIPLSYIAILGGTMTLIGTSTHLIVNSFVVQAGLPELGVFDFFFVGGILLLAGTLTIALLAPFILPKIKMEQAKSKDYFIEAKVPSGAGIIGKSVEDAGLRKLEDLYLAQVVNIQGGVKAVSPEYVIQAGDRLMFAGDPKAAPKLLLIDGIKLPGADHSKQMDQLVEVVLSHQSTLIGNTLKAVNFRNKFDAAVVAIRRGDEQLDSRLSEVVLQAGDALVLITGPDFKKRENLDKNFYFYTDVDAQRHLNTKESMFASIGFITVIVLAALEVLPLIKGLIFLLAGFLLFKLTTINEVRRRLPFEIILIVGAALGVAQVMMDYGAAQQLADWVMLMFSPWGLVGSLVGVYLLTVLLTEMVTNNAAAALGIPIALATAQAFDASAWPYIMVVAYGASASFLTPYGYQTNLMVYSPGGYRFLDYIKMGLPVSIVYGVTVITMVPIFFPF